MTLKPVLALLLPCLMLAACADGNCRINEQNRTDQAVAFRGPAAMADRNPGSDHVKIFKYDGSLQCGQGQAVSPEDMKKEFSEGVVIYSSDKKTDGLMHSMRCGANSGKANVYEIATKDLPAAKKLGYKEWIW